ncbi:hypothetical protein HN799_05310 [Candidatus Woesearchaeota archaeon]|jgi:hypothetical protein|nr:hypothetical protein [Candidatus Woesearchaeota archaeon]MBT4150767.1 hypothetical protein [Candidatus Woesearchaeota archaeon]MBT4247416.1 hypothetical protein [Candidatus Woesearchaeota archaeon]MBT7332663.1 hypothetical protein [Candidatus Woesearchaeota archaeon]
MLLNKKAVTAGFIISIMITLIAFIVISGVLIRFWDQGDDSEAELLCKQSIDLRVATAVRINWVGSSAKLKAVPPLCKTIDKRVTGSRDAIKKEVSHSMARCWEMFGQGKHEELFSNVDTGGIFGSLFGFGGDNDCFNCYTVNIAQDEIKEGSISNEELADYMGKNKYKNTKKTYLDYIQNSGGPGRVIFTQKKIDPRNSYAISFMAKNKESEPSWVSAVKVGAAYFAGPLGWLTYGASGVSNIYQSIYSETDVSQIIFGDLQYAQEECGSGDIAGE